MQFTLGATTPAQIQATLEFDMLSDIPEILAAGFAIWMIVSGMIYVADPVHLVELD